MKKRKYTALLLAAALTASLLTGCASDSSDTTDTTETTETESAAGTIYGQVTSVDADAGTITFDVGEAAAASGDSTDIAAGGMDISSMITLTGESQTVTVTDDTSMTSQAASMGGGQMSSAAGEGGMGEASGDFSGEMPEGTDGEVPADADTDGAGSGEAGADGAQSDSEVPEGSSDSGTPEDLPDDAAAGDGEAPTDAGDGSGEGGGMPDAAASGDFSGGDGQTGQGGDMPDGDMASGDAAADMQATEITIDDIGEGDIISVTCDEDGNVTQIVLLYDSDAADVVGDTDSENTSDSAGIAGVTSSSDISYSALYEITENTTEEGSTYDSTGTDEETVWVNSGAVATFSDMTLTRTSSDSTGGDDSSFYGVGAALLTTVGTTYLSDSTITTDAAGGAGIFSYGDGVAYVSDTTITTQQDTSGGIHVAGGGTLYAWDLTVETNGESSAAIRSDRGSGTMVVDGGTYTSNGTGSPAVYSTAEIAVNDAELTATGSEAVCIEGLNSVYLFECDLTGNMADDDQNDTTWTVTLYQSQSGDSEEGNSTFQMIGGTLTSENGGLFYTTNTESTFLLEDVEITASDDSEFFLMCTGNANARGWGTTGANGADCSFTAIDQEMEGDVIWDSISELDFYITEESTLTGAVINDESYAGNGGSGYCSIYIDSDSTWVVTGDSTVTNLYNAGTIVDEEGSTVSIIGTDGTTYVSGSSSYTITVESYSTSVDLSGASTAAGFSDYEVEKPDALS